MATILSDGSGNQRLSRQVRTHENDGDGLGELLRCARERRGLTLEQISSETKIPRRHLEALEHGNLAALPGEFYRRAEIRAFARAVNLDQDLALAQLDRTPGWPVAREAAPAPAKVHQLSSSSKRMLMVIGVGVAAAVFARSIGRQPLLDPDARWPIEYSGPRGPLQSSGPRGPIESSGPRGPVAAESPRHSVLAAPEMPEMPADSVVGISQRTPLAVPRLPAFPEGAPAVATEPPEAGASSLSSLDATTKTEPAKGNGADASTELVVTTQPAGARVTVDGIGWGSAPVTIRFLPAGSVRIRVIKDGYKSEERVVRLVEGHPSIVDIRLASAQ